jgi:hypothetical protein
MSKIKSKGIGMLFFFQKKIKIFTNQILMKQCQIIQKQQEFNLAIPRFGIYLLGKIKKIFKKLLVNPRI